MEIDPLATPDEVAEFLQKPGRTFDVREDEGDRAGGERR